MGDKVFETSKQEMETRRTEERLAPAVHMPYSIVSTFSHTI